MVKNHFITLNWQIDYFIFKIVDNIFQGEFWKVNKEKLQLLFSKQRNKIIDYKNWNLRIWYIISYVILDFVWFIYIHFNQLKPRLKISYMFCNLGREANWYENASDNPHPCNDLQLSQYQCNLKQIELCFKHKIK
jgi:hypothetical protein